MEAIGRNHEITCAFLQQACLDIERNSLTEVLKFPNLEKYRSIFGGATSNIPLITRSSISKHSKITPVLPGRLPLNKPEGKKLPSHLRMNKGPALVSRGTDPVVKELINSDCFQPVLGAVTRNVGAGPRDRTEYKRKRMSPSVSPLIGQMNPTVVVDGQTDEAPGYVDQASGYSGATGVDMRNPMADASFVLPDRTNSSTSSPAYRPGGSDPLSGSSHTSPPGLGNTPEENRIDLRAFQERMVPQIWQAAQMQSMQDTLFTSSVTEALFSMAGVEETTTGWESWNESMTWRTDMPGP